MAGSEVKVDLIIRELRSPIIFLLAVTITRQISTKTPLLSSEILLSQHDQ